MLFINCLGVDLFISLHYFDNIIQNFVLVVSLINILLSKLLSNIERKVDVSKQYVIFNYRETVPISILFGIFPCGHALSQDPVYCSPHNEQ